MNAPASFIDHTLLKPEATAAQIEALCEEAVEYAFASVCIPPRFVALAAERLYGSEVEVGTVVGFPCGYTTSAAKVYETAEAVGRGAGEIDMVIHPGTAIDGRFAEVEEEIRAVVTAAEGAKVKVILECCLLGDAVKSALVERAVAAGAAFVKTSTGFASGGATIEDVRLLSAAARGRIAVKASGGIRDWSFCRRLIEAGAGRIGTSAGLAILEQWREEHS